MRGRRKVNAITKTCLTSTLMISTGIVIGIGLCNGLISIFHTQETQVADGYGNGDAPCHTRIMQQNSTNLNQNVNRIPNEGHKIMTLDELLDSRTIISETPQMPPEDAWLRKIDVVEELGKGEDMENIKQKKIPKVITKVFLQKTGGIPNVSEMGESLVSAHKSWTELNPGYKVQYFDLKACRDYLAMYFHPVFLRAFDCLMPFAFKVDFFRMVIVYREGGWYSDWKQACVKQNLLSTLSHGRDLVVFREGFKGRIQNGVFGAISRHPLMAAVIKDILKNVQLSYYGDDAFNVTNTALFYHHFKILKMNKIVTNDSIVGRFQMLKREQRFVVDMKKAIVHKCENCSQNKDWENGNNYEAMFANRQCYCEDAASLFQA